MWSHKLRYRICCFKLWISFKIVDQLWISVGSASDPPRWTVSKRHVIGHETLIYWLRRLRQNRVLMMIAPQTILLRNQLAFWKEKKRKRKRRKKKKKS
jgi:hypothetical protein